MNNSLNLMISAFVFRAFSKDIFPISDIHHYEESDKQLTIYCQFLGLYGVDSPLPDYMNQSCLYDTQDANVLKQFYDLFNHRMYVLYFLAQSAFSVLRYEPQFSHLLRSMTGNLVDSSELGLSYCIGQGNYNGLQAMIHSYLASRPVNIQLFVLSWEAIPRTTINQLILGDTALLGQRVLTDSCRIIIEIGPISISDAIYLREKKVLSQLKKQIDDYLQRELTCSLQLNIDRQSSCTTMQYLGLNTNLLASSKVS